MRIQIRNSGSCQLWIQDGKKSDPGSGINIPDPQHWGKLNGPIWIVDDGFKYTQLMVKSEA
jgi:hypothetical protein